MIKSCLWKIISFSQILQICLHFNKLFLNFVVKIINNRISSKTYFQNIQEHFLRKLKRFIFLLFQPSSACIKYLPLIFLWFQTASLHFIIIYSFFSSFLQWNDRLSGIMQLIGQFLLQIKRIIHDFTFLNRSLTMKMLFLLYSLNISITSKSE